MLKNASALTIARVAGDGLNFLFFVIVSRQFGPEGIGHYAFGMAIALLANSSVNFGLEDYSIRECASLNAQKRSSFVGRLVGFQIGLAILVVTLLAAFFSVKRPTAQEIQIVSSLSAYYILLGFSQILFTPAVSQQRMIGPSLAELSCRIGSIFSAIFLVVLQKAPLHVAVLPYPVGGFVLLTIAAFSARKLNKKLSVEISWNQVKETILAAWPFGASIIIFTMQVRLSYLVLRTLSGSEATGIYASAIKFLETGVLPLVYLAFAAYPSLSCSYSANPDVFQRLSDRLFRISMVGGALLAWALILVVPDLIVLILGPSFSSSKPLFPFIGFLGILMAIDLPANRLMLAARLQQQRVKLMSLGVLVNLALAVFLIPFIDVFGAIVATVMGQLVITTLSLGALKSRGLSPFTWSMGMSFFLSMLGAVAAGHIVHLVLGGKWVPAAGSLTMLCLVLLGTGFISFDKILYAFRGTPQVKP